jgi:hypothetical protein
MVSLILASDSYTEGITGIPSVIDYTSSCAKANFQIKRKSQKTINMDILQILWSFHFVSLLVKFWLFWWVKEVCEVRILHYEYAQEKTKR